MTRRELCSLKTSAGEDDSPGRFSGQRFAPHKNYFVNRADKGAICIYAFAGGLKESIFQNIPHQRKEKHGKDTHTHR